MALKEVTRFMKYIQENHKLLEAYNKRLIEYGSYLFTEPSMISSGYYVSPMLPENLEDELLQKIIELDERSAKKLEKISKSNGKKINLKDRLLIKFDAFQGKDCNPIECILSHDELKRHRLFERFAIIAREDGFDITTDDLLYFVGKAVLVIIAEHPDYDAMEIFDEVVKEFD
jgi:MoaA/NifB/PqqE/SkfB family radical SAM enzyme